MQIPILVAIVCACIIMLSVCMARLIQFPVLMKLQSYSDHYICITLCFPRGMYILYSRVDVLLVAMHVSHGMSCAAYIGILVCWCVCVTICACVCVCTFMHVNRSRKSVLVILCRMTLYNQQNFFLTIFVTVLCLFAAPALKYSPLKCTLI